MPKVVDHEQRKHEIAAALWRVVGQNGPAAVSIRTVAAEAGWSTGALRHYFTTREELFNFAVEQSTLRVRARLEARSVTVPTEATLVERIACFAEEILPLDEQRLAEFQVWLAFGERSDREVEIGARMNTELRGLYRRFVAALGGIAPLDDPDAPTDDPWLEDWSEYLSVFIDGLSTQLVFTPEQLSPDRARAALRGFLAAVPLTSDNI